MATITITAFPARFETMSGIRFVSVLFGRAHAPLHSETIEARSVAEVRARCEAVRDDLAKRGAPFKLSVACHGRKPGGYDAAYNSLCLSFDPEAPAVAA